MVRARRFPAEVPQKAARTSRMAGNSSLDWAASFTMLKSARRREVESGMGR